MPYKDVEKRREAYRRWASKNKIKRRNYQRILRIATRANPTPRACCVDGCKNPTEKHHSDYSKPKEIVWVCKKHHTELFHTTKCSICGDKALARGFCNKHYKSERKKIDPDYLRRTRKSQKKWKDKH